MNIGLVIYDSLETISGGYLYDRMLVGKLRQCGDAARIISVPRRRYALSLLDNLRPPATGGLDLVLQDELNHPSLFLANRFGRFRPRVAIVHHLRSSEHRPAWQNAIYRGIEQIYLNSVDAYVFNSETTRRSVERLARRGKPSVVATPGGDRLGECTVAEVRERAREAGPLRAIFVGAITGAKGLHVILDAMADLPRGHFELRVVGPAGAQPEYAVRMSRRAIALGLRVSFLGELDEAALAEELRRSQVLVAPSYYEGFGISLLEGMAHGLPPIAARAGAVPDLFDDGEHGYLIETGDARMLAARLMDLSRDRDLLAKLGLAALNRYRGFPTWDQTTDRIRDFLIRLIRTWKSADA